MSIKELLNLSAVARYFKRSPMRFTRAFDRVSGSCVNDLYHLIHVILPEKLRDYEEEVKGKKAIIEVNSCDNCKHLHECRFLVEAKQNNNICKYYIKQEKK